MKMSNTHDISWIFSLKESVPYFLDKLRSDRRKGFFKYSLSGDYLNDIVKWGLGNSVFFLKIVHTLGLNRRYESDQLHAIKYIQSFQKKNGTIYDPIIRILSAPFRIMNSIRTKDFSNIRNQLNIRAETRQSLSALSMFGINPLYNYTRIPKNKKEIEIYLNNLNWNLPWGSGSHFSHLLFFLYHSNMVNRNDLISFAIRWINRLQQRKDGFWYSGNPSIQQKLNGAMKIITGLKAVNKVFFQYPKKIIDIVLKSKNDNQACDNFNIVYVLKYCNQIVKNEYRYSEIIEFLKERISIYYKYYYPEIGGFSFHKDQANRNYYGALITKGKKEPDIHGTLMFLWGISLIAQVLKVNKELKFNEHIP